MIALVLFHASIALLGYTLVLFPALLLVRGLIWRRPVQLADIEPAVSVVIAAHNEANGIGARIENLLALDYPREKLEIIVASDGSTDGTDAIAKGFSRPGVRVLSLPRGGKIATLNSAVEHATGEILIFSDANTCFEPETIKQLMRPLGDPNVGGVAGNQVYLKGAVGGTAAGELAYWDFDRWLKVVQSRSGNVTSATGALYAIRRNLFRPIPPGVTDDFVVSTEVIAQGYRLVFAPDALAYEPVASQSRSEFRRKVRIMTQGLRATLVMKQLLNPLRFGFYSFQLCWHKVLRRLVVVPLMLLFISNAFLLGEGLPYQCLFAAQAAFYTLALIGLVGPKSKLFSIPLFVCMVQAAALVALLNALRGRRIEQWKPTSSVAASESALPVKPLEQRPA